MSKTEGFLIFDSRNASTSGDIAEKAAKPRPQGVVRKKLADISNLPQNRRQLITGNAQSIDIATKDIIDQLKKENMALVKMLAQKNKIIEQRGTELDRLRVNLLKMQDQNKQLALSNTQMFAELNSGKDRLKVLQHEFGCKSGLLKTRELELEETARTKSCKNADAELIKFREEEESSKEDRNDEIRNNINRSLQSNNVCSSEQVQSKEKTENKRPLVRRQSARFKPAELKPAEDLCETHDPVPEKGSITEGESVKNEDNKGNLRYESQEIGRLSLCRPSRLAAKKVQSYKEIPLNVKMRRPE